MDGDDDGFVCVVFLFLRVPYVQPSVLSASAKAPCAMLSENMASDNPMAPMRHH